MTALWIERAAAVSPLGSSLDEIWQGLLSGAAVFERLELPGARRFFAARCGGGDADLDGYAGAFAERLRSLIGALQIEEPVGALFLGTAVGTLAQAEARIYEGAPIPARVLDFAALRDLIADLPAVGPGTRFVCVPTGCCAGLQAIGLAKAILPRLGVERAIVAGLDFGLTPLAFQAFARINAIAADAPGEGSPSRPFCAQRGGFLFADGGGALLVSTRPRAEAGIAITGYGCVSSAFHMTDIRTDGSSIRASLEEALADAGRSPPEIGHVNLHGSGTRQNDEAEYRALKDVFGAQPPPATAFKAHHGHALGGANLVETALCWKMMRENVAPPTPAGLPMDAFRELPPRADPAPLAAQALAKTASGFGGIHAALVMEKTGVDDLRH